MRTVWSPLPPGGGSVKSRPSLGVTQEADWELGAGAHLLRAAEENAHGAADLIGDLETGMASHAVLEGVDMSGPAAQFAGPAAPAPPGTGRSGWPLGKPCLSDGRRWRVTISAVRPAWSADGWRKSGVPGPEPHRSRCGSPGRIQANQRRDSTSSPRMVWPGVIAGSRGSCLLAGPGSWPARQRSLEEMQ